MRLHKFLADMGIASRRKCEALIRAGKIFVNGARAKISDRIDPDRDQIFIDGKKIKEGAPSRPAPDKPVYYILNKPRGYLSTVSDPSGRPTILNLVKVEARVYPVGRLDKNSEGLILLTND